MSAKTEKTVLVIDDSPVDVAVVSEILKTDYRVLGAMGPESALKILHSEKPPDLVLLDIMMPDVDGLQLCRRIRSEAATSRIPVIFVTSKDGVEDEAAGFAAGGVDYIVKPVNPHLVMARVRAHLELKAAREELERQNATLVENARLREEVEHLNRHDLKNPLMVILTVPGVLMHQANITTEQQSWLRLIEDAGRKMLEMINRSIDIYKMESGTYELHATTVDLLEVARKIVMAYTPAAAAKKVFIEISLRGSPPKAGDTFSVLAEELLLYSMLGNLVKNAVEASPTEGRVLVSLALSPNSEAVLEIHNAGAVPEKIRGRLFEKYATAGKQGGTGLGAYSARMIAHTLGGSIRCASSEQSGTTISITFPMQQV